MEKLKAEFVLSQFHMIQAPAVIFAITGFDASQKWTETPF